MEPAPCTVTLWHASGVEAPRELLDALSGAKPGSVRIHSVGDPFMALASLCRAVRDEQRRAEPAEPTSVRLVIVYPEMLTEAADMCIAADTYAPGVPRWQYGPATSPTLRRIADDDVARWAARGAPVVVVPGAGRPPSEPAAPIPAAPLAPPARTSRTTPSGPQLRLAGEGPIAGPGLDNPSDPSDDKGASKLAGEGAPGSTPPRSAPLITDEELRMLLGEHNEER